MERLTHKVDGKYYPSMNNLVQEKDYQSSNYRGLIHEKLGRIEDLMENYGIESVEELELIIKDHKRLYNFIDIKNNLGEVDSDITPDYLAYVVSNGITYGKLSKELGCDLGVVIKALLDGGIIDNYGLGCQLNGVVLDGSGDIYLSAVNGDLSNIKDYQKTWWLASDKKEKQNDN